MQKTTMAAIVFVVGLGMGLLGGLAIQQQQYTQLKEIDDQLLHKYSQVIEYAGDGFECNANFDAECIDEQTKKIEDITPSIHQLVDQRAEL